MRHSTWVSVAFAACCVISLATLLRLNERKHNQPPNQHIAVEHQPMVRAARTSPSSALTIESGRGRTSPQHSMAPGTVVKDTPDAIIKELTDSRNTAVKDLSIANEGLAQANSQLTELAESKVKIQSQEEAIGKQKGEVSILKAELATAWSKLAQARAQNDTTLKGVAAPRAVRAASAVNTAAADGIAPQITPREPDALVDCVILWVNATATADAASSDFMRFREWGELVHVVRLLRKLATNRGRIVVAGNSAPHVPIPGVEYVLDRDYIPPKHMPTRNSLTKQWNIHRLARKVGLSDPFMVWNDDMFLGKQLDLREHAAKNTWYTEGWGNHGYGQVNKISPDTYIGSVQSANRALRAVFDPKHVPGFQAAHVPAVVRLATMDWAWQHLPVEASLTELRNSKNLQFEYTLAYAEKQIVAGASVRKQADCKGVYGLSVLAWPVSKMRGEFDQILSRLRANPVTFFNLNDDLKSEHFDGGGPRGNGYAVARSEIQRFLSTIGS